MRGLLGSMRILFIIFLCGCKCNNTDTFLDSDKPTTQNQLSSADLTGYSVYFGHNVAYKIYYDHVTWDEARHRCILNGGDLAIAETRDKIEYIKSIYSGTEAWAYIGIHKPAGSQKWIRVNNGSPVTSLPWISSPSIDSGYDCAAITYGRSLTDINCEWRQNSVCQISFREDPVTTTNEEYTSEYSDKEMLKTDTTAMASMITEELVFTSTASSYTSDGCKNTIIYYVLFFPFALLAYN